MPPVRPRIAHWAFPRAKTAAPLLPSLLKSRKPKASLAGARAGRADKLSGHERKLRGASGKNNGVGNRQFGSPTPPACPEPAARAVPTTITNGDTGSCHSRIKGEMVTAMGSEHPRLDVALRPEHADPVRCGRRHQGRPRRAAGRGAAAPALQRACVRTVRRTIPDQLKPMG